MPKPRKQPNGTWTLIVSYLRSRKQLTLGKITKPEADLFSIQVQQLIDHRRHGGPALPAPLQSWLNSINQKHRQQLADLGLFVSRPVLITIGDLLDEYLTAYQASSVADSTKTKVESSIRNRFDKIKACRIDAIEPRQVSTRANADPVRPSEATSILKQFNVWQRNFFAPATWTRDNKLLSSVGIWAVKAGHCDFNPFVGLPTASMINEERNEYVTLESATDAMDSCLDADTRLTIAMGRLCGLRTCSEVRTMKWSHVDYDGNTITVIDSKKKTPRIMPLFDSAKAELKRQQAITGETRWVISSAMRATTSAASYARVKQAIARSGQEIWPRIRQNLRASCENDLLEIFPERLVTNWLGHTVGVSRAHYQKLRASDYETAIETARRSGILQD